MTTSKQLLACIELGDGIFSARKGKVLQRSPLRVIGVDRTDGTVVVDLRGPQGGEYQLVSEPGEPVRKRYEGRRTGRFTAPVEVFAVVPADMMPGEDEQLQLAGQVEA